MSKIFYSMAEKMRYILESVHKREVLPPVIQRDIVWDPRETEVLIESICQNLPEGILGRHLHAVSVPGLRAEIPRFRPSPVPPT